MGITHIGAALTIIFGLWMMSYSWGGYLSQGWMHAKLFFVLLLLGYHHWCMRLVKDFKEDNNKHSEKWYRFFNEAPALVLVVVVILVIVKPF